MRESGTRSYVKNYARARIDDPNSSLVDMNDEFAAVRW